MFNFVLKRAMYQAVRQPIHRYCNCVFLHSAHDGQGGGGAAVVGFREIFAEVEKARRGWEEQRRQENDQLLDHFQKARLQDHDLWQKAKLQENDLWQKARLHDNEMWQKAKLQENVLWQKAKREENDLLLGRLKKDADDHRKHCEKLGFEIGDLKV